jgi:hypothetical protein
MISMPAVQQLAASAARSASITGLPGGWRWSHRDDAAAGEGASRPIRTIRRHPIQATYTALKRGTVGSRCSSILERVCAVRATRLASSPT